MAGAPTIARAIQARAEESEILDFKRDAYKDGAEWAKDVTAFANSTGGKILIGVDEDVDGRARDAVGIEVDFDKEVQRLNNWLHHLTDPDATAVTRIRGEVDDQGRKFLVVDIEESAFAPHRLTVQNSKLNGQVYVRRGRDNRPVSMAQIRDMVLGTHRTQKAIQEFVEGRISGRNFEKSIEQLRPAGYVISPKASSVLFHVCPRRGFGSRKLVDWVLENNHLRLGPDKVAWQRTVPNPLGAIAAVGGATSYLASHQCFYNGATELFYPGFGTEEFTDGGKFKRCVDEPITHVLATMHDATGCDQFEVFTWVTGVERTRLVWNDTASYFTSGENSFELPAVLVRIGPDGQPLAADLRQLLDLFWRAWGTTSCPI